MSDYREKRSRKRAFELTEQLDDPIDLYQHLPFQIAVVSNLLQLNRDLAIRDIIELEPRELRVILNIGSYMPISGADIAYQSRMDSYTISRAVKKLRDLEMIETTQLEDNRKVKYLVLSEKGEAVYRRLQSVIDERTQQLESVITTEEKQQLMQILARLEDQAEHLLANHAKQHKDAGQHLPADQKEIIRWRKKSEKS